MISCISRFYTKFTGLTSLTSVSQVNRMNQKIHELDIDIRSLIKEQTTAANDGREALDNAKDSITNLFSKIKDIRLKAEQSEVRIINSVYIDIILNTHLYTYTSRKNDRPP